MAEGDEEAERVEIQRQFAARRRVTFSFLGAMLALGLGFVALYTLGALGHRLYGISPVVWVVLAFATALIGDRLSKRWWRCPKCEQVLGKTWNPLQCERCGVSLRAEGSIARDATRALSSEQLAWIAKDYARLRLRQFYVSLPFMSLYVVAVLSSMGLTLHPVLDVRNKSMQISIVSTLAVWISFSIWNWRCPACRAYLGKTTDGRHCRRCGVQLWE